MAHLKKVVIWTDCYKRLLKNLFCYELNTSYSKKPGKIMFHDVIYKFLIF